MDKVQLSLVDEGIDTEGSSDVQRGLRVAADWELDQGSCTSGKCACAASLRASFFTCATPAHAS